MHVAIATVDCGFFHVANFHIINFQVKFLWYFETHFTKISLAS